MGQAMAKGWIRRGIAPERILAVDPFFSGKAEYRVLPEIPSGAEPQAVALAVKPQDMDEVLPKLAGFGRALFISIAAGKKISYFEKALPGKKIVRAMPNLPAIIGRGVSVACANREALPDKELAEKLLSACGEVFWVEDEALLDSVTALSGSGPAYFFLLMEAMAKAGEKLGLSREMALRLATLTARGSAELAFSANETPGELRQAVTSKGGTTEAALAKLAAFPDMVMEAMNAAAKRSRELSE